MFSTDYLKLEGDHPCLWRLQPILGVCLFLELGLFKPSQEQNDVHGMLSCPERVLTLETITVQNLLVAEPNAEAWRRISPYLKPCQMSPCWLWDLQEQARYSLFKDFLLRFSQHSVLLSWIPSLNRNGEPHTSISIQQQKISYGNQPSVLHRFKRH
jgi:hypothetical protein